MLIFLGCILSLATPSANEPWGCFSSCIGSNNNEWTVRWQEEGEEGQGSAAWRSSQAHALNLLELSGLRSLESVFSHQIELRL